MSESSLQEKAIHPQRFWGDFLLLLCLALLSLPIVALRLQEWNIFHPVTSWKILVFPLFVIGILGLFSFQSRKTKSSLIARLSTKYWCLETVLVMFVICFAAGHYFFRPVSDIGRRLLLPLSMIMMTSAGLLGILLIRGWKEIKSRIVDITNKFRKQGTSILIVSLIFLVLIAVKVLIYDHHSYATLATDESYYLYNAETIFTGKMFSQNPIYPFYPPLYSILLTPSYAIGHDPFRIAIILNAIYSSTTVFITYLLAKKYTGSKYALLCSLLSALLPFQMQFTRQILSENLFIPLILLAVYLSLKKNTGIKHTLFFGFTLACLFLTRYIALVVLPVFVVVWISQQALEKDRHQIAVHLFLLLLTVCLLYGSWVFYGLVNGFSLPVFFGRHITASTTDGQLTLIRLIFWIIRVVFYSILLIGPFLYPSLVMFINNFPSFSFNRFNKFDLDKVNRNISDKSRLVITVLLMTMMFWVSIIRHYWRAYYNYPDITKFSSRYFAFLVPVILILFVIGCQELKNMTRTKKIFLIIGSDCLTIISYILVFHIPLFSFPAFNDQIVRSLTTLDIFPFLTEYRYLYLLILVIVPFFWLVIKQRGMILYNATLMVLMISSLYSSYNYIVEDQKLYFGMKLLSEQLQAEESVMYDVVKLYMPIEIIGEIVYSENTYSQNIYWHDVLFNQADFELITDQDHLCGDMAPGTGYFTFLRMDETGKFTSMLIDRREFVNHWYDLNQVECP